MAGGIIGRLLVKLGLDNKEYLQGLDQSKQKTSGFSGFVSRQMKQVGGAIAAAFAFKNIAGFLNQSAEIAGKVEGVRKAFDRINQPNLLDNLKEATRGTVDELKLMQVAVQAKNFKIPIDNLATYLQFATQRAKETGESVDYLVQSIVLGIGRKSPLILDNLGIGALEVREEFNKTGDMAKAVANIIDREMDSASDSVVTLADKAQRAEASWRNMMAEIGKTQAVKGVKGWFYDLKIAISELLPVMLEFGVGIKSAQGISSFQKNVIDQISKSSPDAESKLTKLNAALSNVNKTLETYKKGESGFTLPTAGGAIEFGGKKSAITIDDITLKGIGAEKQYQLELRKREIILEEINKTELDQQKNTAISRLDLENKTLSQLRALRDSYKDKELTGVQVAELEAIKAAIQSYGQSVSEVDEQQSKTFAQTEKELKASISALEKQRSAYGDTLVFLEEELKLKRQLEQFAQSDAERLKIKGENDELEKQIQILKNPSITHLKDVLQDIGKEMVLLFGSGNVNLLSRPIINAAELIKKGWQEAGDGIATVFSSQFGIKDYAGNIREILVTPILPDGSVLSPQELDDYVYGVLQGADNILNADKKGLVISIDVDPAGAAGEKLHSLQEQYYDLKNLINQKYEVGSEADLKAQLDDAEKAIEKLNTTTIEGRRQFAELANTIVDLKSKIDSLPQNYKINVDISADIKSMTAEADAMIKKLLEPWSELQKRNEQFNEEFRQTLENGAIAGLSGLGEAIGNLATGDTDAVWQALLNPIADMAVKLGELAIASGITFNAIGDAMKNPFGGGFGAIAAGIALVALGAAIKAATSNIAKGGGGRMSNSPNTFTGGGGYSNSGALPDNAFRNSQVDVNITGTFTQSGRDLVAVIDKQDKYNSR